VSDCQLRHGFSSTSLFACPHGTNRLPLDGVSLHLVLENCTDFTGVSQIQILLKSEKTLFVILQSRIYVNISQFARLEADIRYLAVYEINTRNTPDMETCIYVNISQFARFEAEIRYLAVFEINTRNTSEIATMEEHMTIETEYGLIHMQFEC
jgi:hypothetical protein